MVRLKAQAAFEFLTQYAVEILLLGVAIAAVYTIEVPLHQTTYSPSYCYLTPALPCGQILITSNSLETVITLIFTNDMGQSIYLPGDPAFYVAPTATSAYTAGTCDTTATSNVLKAGSSTVCSATLSGFTVRAGAQLQPLFYINYEVCSNPTCSSIVNNPSTFRGENTSGSAVGYVTPTGGVSISPPASTTSTSSTSTTTSSTTTSTTSTTTIGSGGSFAYVVNYAASGVLGNNVVIINTATNSVVSAITSGFSSPTSVAFAPDGTYAYVSNAYSKNVVIINTATNSVVGQITSALFSAPTGVSFSPDGTYAYIADAGTNNVVIISTASNSVVGEITAGFNDPWGTAISPSGTFAYIINAYSRNAVIVNTETNSIVGAITSGFPSTPYHDAFSPSGTFAYVAVSGNNIAIIDVATNTVSSLITSSSLNSADGVAFAPSGTYAYATQCGSCGSSSNVVIINTATNSVTGLIASGFFDPYDVAFYPGLTVTISPLYTQTITSGSSVTFTATGHAGSGGYSYQWYTAPGAGQCSSSDTAISGATASTYTATPSSTTYYCVKVTDSSGGTAYSWATEVVVNVLNSELESIAVSPDGSTVYVSGTSGTLAGGPAMYAINTLTNSVLALPINYAENVAVTPDGKYVYADNGGNGAVNYIYKVSTLTDSITNTVSIDVTAGSGEGMAITPDGKTAYLGGIEGSATPNSVYALNTSTNTITNSILVGSWSDGGYVTAAPDNSLVYVDIQSYGDAYGGVNVISTLTNTVVNSISFNAYDGYSPSGMAITPSGALLYVASASGNIIVVSTSTNSVVNAIPGVVAVGTYPSGLAITPSGSTAYATNLALNTISVINIPTNTVTNTIQNVGYDPVAVAFSPNGEYAYAASQFNTANTAWSGRPYGEVDVIDVASNTVIKRINYTDSSS